MMAAIKVIEIIRKKETNEEFCSFLLVNKGRLRWWEEGIRYSTYHLVCACAVCMYFTPSSFLWNW